MEFHNKKAIYLQIADYFYDNILRKKMKEGERIPSVRDLAVQTEVNPNTVMRTYTYLQNNEIIYNKRGIGYFISEGAFDKSLDSKKNEFIKDELPGIFKTMQALNMSFEDVKKLYDNFVKSN